MIKRLLKEKERQTIQFLEAVRDGEYANPHNLEARLRASEILLTHFRETLWMEVEQEDWER